MFHPGDSIGPYSLVRMIGRGAFGEVWLANRVATLLTTQVALKLPLDIGTDLDTVRREAEFWLRASGHTNIVPVLEAEIYNSQVVIVSEYVAGGSLEDFRTQHAEKAATAQTAVAIVRGILAGLAHLHENGLIHRDLKPANVLLQRGVPRLTDFGLTRVLRPSGQSSNLAGTPAYMAPEAFQGQYSAQSDLWSVGIVLHELLAGCHPYPQTDFYALLMAVTSEAPVALSERVPVPLRPVLQRALSKDAAARFASAQEMDAALLNATPARPLMSVAERLPEGTATSSSAGSMRLLPSGTVTFLFTDIEGGTELWERRPNEMALARARYVELLTGVIEKHGGLVFKVVEDGLCSAFGTAPDAAAASFEAQRALLGETWPEEMEISARMALHTGAIELRDGEYYGRPLNRVSRILAAGHGGQVLFSEITQQLVPDSLPEGASFKSLGHHRLRDLAGPEAIYQLMHPDLPYDFPSLSSLDNPLLPNNLPHQVTSFIGREREIKEVESLLSGTRLLTLTGIGGCGKSRLCMHVAAEQLAEYRDGVWLVELSRLSDPSAITQAVASVFGRREEPGKSQTHALLEYLKPRQLLLVLDNCEHVLDTCAELAVTFLQNCPGIRILASSREAIGIAAEQVYHVQPLSLPTPGTLHTEATLDRFESTRLFIERAVVVQPNFAVTEVNAPAIAELCFRLDGIPLAIELAAARIRSLSVEQVNARLDSRFRLLTGGGRTALPQHQTLSALIDWSFDLLDPTAKSLFVRLSVFAGGWSLQAAECICSGDGIEDFDMLGLLMALVDKSLVVYEDGGSEARYRLLETFRQYAAERLAEVGESVIYRARHRDYYLSRAQDAVSKLNGPEHDRWMSEIEAEFDNLREALGFCLADPDSGAQGLLLAVALNPIWQRRGFAGEGREKLAAAQAHASLGQIAGPPS